MAADYWRSTHHRHWTFTRTRLQQCRTAIDNSQSATVAQYPLPDQRLVAIFLREQLLKLSRRLPTRQPILSTTLLYLARYWLVQPIRNTNPFLLLATCFYLASKTEELPHHIRLVLTEAKNIWTEYIPGDVYRMGECEFEVISALRSQLIVFHPYSLIAELTGRTDAGAFAASQGTGYSTGSLSVGMSLHNALSSQQGNFGYGQGQPYGHQTAKETTEASNPSKKWTLNLSPEETAMAWSIVNDSYLTDLPLLYPPHVIAIMAIFLAVVFQPNRSQGLNMYTTPAQQQPIQQSFGNVQQIHSLPPKPTTVHHQPQSFYSSSSLGGNRGIANAIRDSSISKPVGANGNQTATKSQSEKVEKMVNLLAESEIDIEKVIDATQEIVSLYEVWESYSEKNVKEAIVKFMKGRTLEK